MPLPLWQRVKAVPSITEPNDKILCHIRPLRIAVIGPQHEDRAETD